MLHDWDHLSLLILITCSLTQASAPQGPYANDGLQIGCAETIRRINGLPIHGSLCTLTGNHSLLQPQALLAMPSLCHFSTQEDQRTTNPLVTRCIPREAPCLLHPQVPSNDEILRRLRKGSLGRISTRRPVVRRRCARSQLHIRNESEISTRSRSYDVSIGGNEHLPTSVHLPRQ